MPQRLERLRIEQVKVKTAPRHTGRAKVKSGCRTCKIRRVKCDEKKPACDRCLATGRKCDGYGIWSSNEQGPMGQSQRIDPSSPKALSAHNMPIPLPGTTKEERDYFDFFCRKTALKLPGVFESNFWERLVFQASSNEPAVLHAVIALASAHKSEELTCDEVACAGLLNRRFRNEGPMNVHDRFALQQYNKAIINLRTHLSISNQCSLHVTLITCMMFICLELLRGEFKTAGTHLQNGLNLLSQAQNGVQDTVVVRPYPESVEDYLIEAFARLNVQSALFGLGSQHLYIIGQDLKCGPDFRIPISFSNVYETRQYLDGLLNAVFNLIEDASKENFSQSEPSPLLQRQNHLRPSLAAWLSAYDASLSSFLPNLTSRRALGLPLLRIYHTMTTIMLCTSLSRHERDFDAHLSSFISIIDQCINIGKLAELPIEFEASELCRGQNIRFTVDMGFIPPLYYTALKCRDPVTRRRALKLLQTAPHREGMWDPAIVAKVAEMIMKLEEGQFFEGINVGSLDIEAKEQLPPLPEIARFRDVKVVMSEDVKGTGTLMCRRCPLGEKVKEERFEFDFNLR